MILVDVTNFTAERYNGLYVNYCDYHAANASLLRGQCTYTLLRDFVPP